MIQHTIIIPGEPPRQTHQSRLRAYRIGKFCRIVKAKPDAVTSQLERKIAGQVAFLRQDQPHLFAEGVPVRCTIEWAFPFPAAVKAKDRKHHQWRTQRPDLDNLTKTVLDALTDAGAWVDDAQVVCLTLFKFNSPKPQLTIGLMKAD